MKFITRFGFTFVAVAVSSMILMNVFKVEFGQVDYWSNHGLFLLVFLALFPRLTLLFSSIPFGGFFWWLGFFFFPRILVAILATVAYFQTNPFLVVMSWVFALGGEFAEKYGVSRSKFRVYNMGSMRTESSYQEAPRSARQFPDDAIEAEFTKKD